jgi:hypothetical protein
MRDIKFRAWDKENKVMYDLGYFGDIFFGTNHEEEYGNDLTKYEVMQYTGLKDSKRTEEYPEGQEIYEGDIVKETNIEVRVEVVDNMVEWLQHVGFLQGREQWTEEDVEVIGNIYEDRL